MQSSRSCRRRSARTPDIATGATGHSRHPLVRERTARLAPNGGRCRDMLVALTLRTACAGSSPMFRFRSKRGKLLLETSRRSLCPVSQPQNPAGQILRKSIRPNIHEHAREVRVNCRAAYVQIQRDRSSYLCILDKRRSRVYQHVFARFCRPLILRPNSTRQSIAAERPTDCRHRVARVIGVLVRLFTSGPRVTE
jgi:hypothetical protein